MKIISLIKFLVKLWYQKLWMIVIIFMILGVLFGIYYPQKSIYLKPIISNFMHIIKVFVGPIIFISITTSIVGMNNLKQFGKIGATTLLYFEIMSTVALILGWVFGYIFKLYHPLKINITQMINNTSSSAIGTQPTEHITDLKHLLLSMVPDNLWSPFLTQNNLQIIFCALIGGLAISLVNYKIKTFILKYMNLLQRTLFRLLAIIMIFSPVAAFASIAFMISTCGSQILWSLLGFIICMILACLFFIFVILGSFLAIIKINIFKVIKLIKDEIIVVFATSSSESAFSLIIKKLTDSGINSSVVNVVIPTGYSFNLDGSNIYFSLAIMFLCHTLDIHLTTLEQLSILFTLMLTSKGSAGVVGAAFIVLTDTLASIHTKIPISAVVIL